MKKTYLSAAIAIVGFAAFQTANAQVSPGSYSAGDIFIGFESASLSKNYVVDIGADITAFSSLSLGADLATTFGTNWYGVSDLKYGVFGLASDDSYVIASVPAGNAAPVKKAAGALATADAHYNAMVNGLNTSAGNGQGLTLGTYQNVGTGADTGLATWSGNAKNTPVFTIYNSPIENSITSLLDVYTTTGTTSTAQFKAIGGALGGSLQVSSLGVISAVPEPGTYALFGLGALLLVIAVRRKSHNA